MTRSEIEDTMSSDQRGRSILKTVTWRIIATGTTAGLVYLFSGEATLALGVGGA